MLNRVFSAVIFVLLLANMLTLAFNIQAVNAAGTIYIRADGSIDPPTAPISAVNNSTYILAGNITCDADGIVIERNNVTLDGAGFTLRGKQNGVGISMMGRSNATVTNANINNFTIGVLLGDSFYNNIIANNITNNSYGIMDYGSWLYSSNNNIKANNMTANNEGINFSKSSNNTIKANNITANVDIAILLTFSSNNNSISQNNIANNGKGIWLHESSNNSIVNNNFANNTQQVYVEKSGYANHWDGNYPSGGNYWSDYNGTDGNQDGIGDAPYVVDANNTDHYPLMGTFQSFNVSVYYRIPSQFEEVDIISNSTIGQAYLSWADDARNPPTYMDWFLLLSGFVGQNGTVGFCRITLPNDILNSTSYHVGTWTQWNNDNLTISKVLSSNGTHTTLYFTYEVPNPLPFPEFDIIIIPEFPSFLILPLFFMATLLAVIIYRKKHAKISGVPRSFSS